VTSLLIEGNAFAAVAARDALGFPQSLVLLAPAAVSVRQDQGVVSFQVAGQEFDPDDIVHIRGVTLPGHVLGLGPLQVQRRTVGQAIAQEDYASELFVGGSIPSGVLQVDGELSRDEADELKTHFSAAHGGRQRTPAVLSGGVKYQALGFSAADLELLESRRFSAQTIATIFGVPGFLIGVGQENSQTYSNVEQDSKLFVRFTLRSWAARIEQALSALLPRGQEARFNLDALLRADTAERYSAHETALRAGFLTLGEVREMENLEPLPEPEPEPMPAPDDEDDVDD